jgi:hypothetical protein
VKVTLTAVEGELEISSINDFKLVLGKGTSLTLEIREADFILRESSPAPRKKSKPSVSKFKRKNNLRVVK